MDRRAALRRAAPQTMFKVHTALLLGIHGSPEVVDFGLDDIGDDALSLLQLRANSALLTPSEDCALVDGDGVGGAQFNVATIAYDATVPYVQGDIDDGGDTFFMIPGQAGTPVQSMEECYQRVQSMNDLAVSRGQPKPCWGLSLPTGGVGQCYCQRGITATDGNPAWQSCKFGGFTQSDLFDTVEGVGSVADLKKAGELGCFFVTGDGNGRERKIADVNSREECVGLVRDQCPDATGITMGAKVTPTSKAPCVCEFDSSGSNGNNGYQYCQLDAPEPEPELVIDGKGFDGACDWYKGQTNGDEEKTPRATSPEHCAQMVRQQCPDSNAASLRISGSGDCFCERGATNSRGPLGNGMGGETTTWQSCRFDLTTTTQTPTQPSADDASAVGDPHLTSAKIHSDLCCDHGVCKPCAA